MHEQNPHYGVSGERHKSLVKQLAIQIGSTDILDYGCGKETLRKSLHRFSVTGYDPAIPGLDKTPEPHDIVYCGDVLEHIEPECLDAVLDDINRVMKQAGILIVNSDPACKFLEDGRNAHLIQKPMHWWAEQLNKRFRICNYISEKSDEHIFIVQEKRAYYRRWDWIHELAQANGWKRGAELGVKEGRFSCYLALRGISMISVDLWASRPEMAGVEGGETYEKFEHDKYLDKFLSDSQGLPITIFREDTKTAHNHIEDGSLDFCFIDGDHSYQGVLIDIKNWRPKVRKGGYICGHDANWETVNKAVCDSFPKSVVEIGPDNVWGVWV